jgi:hypothetical protein
VINERDGAEDVGGQALLSVLLLEGLLPEGGCELEDAGHGPGRDEAEEVAEVSPGLDAVELAAGQEGDEDRVDACSLVAAEEQPVFASEDLPPKVSLGDIVVEREPAVVDKAREGDTLVAGVADRLGDRGLVEDDGGLFVTPGEKSIDNGARLLAVRIPVDLGTRTARDLGRRSGPLGRIGAERRVECVRGGRCGGGLVNRWVREFSGWRWA